MKIAFILPSLANRGPIVFTQYLIQGLKHFCDVIHVYYFDEIREINLEVECYRISIFKCIDIAQYDIVHTTGARPDLYGAIHHLAFRGKKISSAHNYFTEDLSLLYSKPKAHIYTLLWKCALFSYNDIIVSSQSMLRYYSDLIGPSKRYVVIPYGIEKKEMQPLAPQENIFLKSLRDKYTIIGSVGLLIKRKGFDQLIYFLENNPEYAVVIIGEGDEREVLLRLAKKHNVSDRFFLLGFKNNSIDYYSHFDVYAMVSHSEGFGLAMLEAMSQSVPVVCSKLDIYDGYFNDDDVAYFSVGDLGSLTTAFSVIKSNKDKFIRSSKRLYESIFSLESMVRKHIQFYNEIISNNNSK